MDEGLPGDLESLSALAKLMQVAPNITDHVDAHGFPENPDVRFMYEVSLVYAIKHELNQREFEAKWQSS